MVVCNECAYCSPTPGGSLYCALTDHFVPNLGCKDGEPINKPKTNADRIRAMSDEDLAEMFCLMSGGVHPFSISDSSDGEQWIEWLKEEVSE